MAWLRDSGHVPKELCIPAEILPHRPGWPLCCYDNTLTKNSVERKGVYLQITIFINKGSQDRDPKAGDGAETLESGACRLAPHGMVSLLSYMTQDHLAGTTHKRRGPHTSIIHQKKMPPQASSQASLVEAMPQLVTPVFVKLTKINLCPHSHLSLLYRYSKEVRSASRPSCC